MQIHTACLPESEGLATNERALALKAPRGERLPGLPGSEGDPLIPCASRRPRRGFPSSPRKRIIITIYSYKYA